MMEILLTVLEHYTSLFLLVLVVLVVVIGAQYVEMRSQFRQMKRRYMTLTRGGDGVDLGQVMEKLATDLASLQETVVGQKDTLVDMNQRLGSSLKKTAIVRYNAFDFTYGELSFSLAVIDDLNNGFIFTNIHNRDDARCYCKMVNGGTSKRPLSDEEKEALEAAINIKPGISRAVR